MGLVKKGGLFNIVLFLQCLLIQEALAAQSEIAPSATGPKKIGCNGNAIAQPNYPFEARMLGEEGVTILHASINEKGESTSVRVEQSSGSVRLDQEALDVFNKWCFVPASKDGKAIPTEVRIPLTFHLDDNLPGINDPFAALRGPIESPAIRRNCDGQSAPVDLQYPPESRRLGEEGTTEILVLVSETGGFLSARVGKSSGYPRLDQEALRAASQWCFMPAQENGHAVRKLMKIPLSFTLEDSPPSNKFSYNEAETIRVLKDVKEAQAKLYSKNVAIEKQIVDLDVPQIYAASSLATKMGRNASKKKLESLRALSKQANDATNDYLNELILKSKSSSDISIEEKERFEAALKELSKPLFKLLFDSYVNQVNIINSSISLISFCEKNSSKMKVVDLELAILDEDVQEGFEEIFQQIVDLTDKQEELEKAITEFSTNFQNIGNAEFDTDSSPADLRQAWNEIKEMSKQADEQSKLINEASH